MATLDDVDSNILANKVLARLTAGLPGVSVFDGKVPDTVMGAYVVMASMMPTSARQRYNQTRPTYHWDYSVMAVNNSPGGVRLLGDKLRRLLDDQNADAPPTDGLYSWPDYDSGLITDDSIEGDWRHSVTCYFKGRTT